MRLFFVSGTAMASRATVICGPSAFSRIAGLALLGRREVGDEQVLPLHDRAGLDVLHVENLVGELLGENARLDVGGELLGGDAGSAAGTSSRIAVGVSQMERRRRAAVARSAKIMTGAITFWLGTPAARMAVISPSLDMRPRPIRMPTSTPNGIVNGSSGGKVEREQVGDYFRLGGAADQQLEEPVRCSAER